MSIFTTPPLQEEAARDSSARLEHLHALKHGHVYATIICLLLHKQANSAIH